MSPQRQAASLRLTKVAAFASSLLFVSFLVLGTSRGAFSDTTSNVSNSASAGSISIEDDDSGSVMFNVSGMVPNDTAINCIEVTYQGDVTPSSAIQLYRSGANTGSGLDQYLDLDIEIGTGGSFGSCAGFSASSTLFNNTLQNFAATHLDFASAIGTGWTPTGAGQSRTFRFTLTLQDDNAAQGLSAGFGFTWEARS